MRRILIATYSKYGQTRKIGRYLARKIEEDFAGPCDFVYYDLEKDGDKGLPPLIDAVVVGAPIRFGKIPRPVVRWARAHRFELMAMRSPFFVVCLNAADPRPKARVEEAKILEKFFLATHWEPSEYRIFAGALMYREYSPPLRWIMKRISRSAGGPVDTSKDHELTDYKDVDAFAKQVVREIEERHQLSQSFQQALVAK